MEHCRNHRWLGPLARLGILTHGLVARNTEQRHFGDFGQRVSRDCLPTANDGQMPPESGDTGIRLRPRIGGRKAPRVLPQWCLRCLLLVMCTYPFAKKALTLYLARSEGHERYFGCNLMQCKVLASSHQHSIAEAPEFASIKFSIRQSQPSGRLKEGRVVNPPEAAPTVTHCRKRLYVSLRRIDFLRSTCAVLLQDDPVA